MRTAAIDQTTPATAATAQPSRAIVQHHYGVDPGAVLELADVARPTIGADQVLVRVVAASVDRGTWHCMTGMPYAMRLAGFGVRAPKASNPGRAFAGTVAAIGRDVTGYEPGDEVYGSCDGSFAEYASVETSMLAPKPANLSFEQAAAAPISGVTALQAVRMANIESGQKVLVMGASGGVGTYAVQIAKARGAEVTGVCSPAKMDLVRALGADHVIDYTVDDFVGGEVRYHVILDIGGNRRLSHLRQALTAHGTLVVVGGETDGRLLGGFQRSLAAVALSPFVRQNLRMLASKENAEDLRALSDLIEAGHVTSAVDRVYPLSETADAIEHMSAGRAKGKVVIAVS